MMFKLTTFNHVKANRGRTITVDMDGLIKGLLGNMGTLADKQQIPLWSPATFMNGHRNKMNTISIHHLVFDMDDGIAPIDSWRLFTRWTVLAHTSYSHKPHHHKFRIILPLKNPINGPDWDRAAIAAQRLWTNIVSPTKRMIEGNEVQMSGVPDPKALKDRARVYFRYAHPSSEHPTTHPQHPNHIHQTHCHIGQLLDLDYSDIIIQQPRPRTTTRVYQNGKANIKDVFMDYRFRLRVANELGATIQGNEARYILCPSCSRQSVHFSIEPSLTNSYKWPTCNHQNSCGWWGSFTDLNILHDQQQ